MKKIRKVLFGAGLLGALALALLISWQKENMEMVYYSMQYEAPASTTYLAVSPSAGINGSVFLPATSHQEMSLLDAYTEHLKLIQDTYMERISELLLTARAEYKSLPAEQQTRFALIKLAPKYASEGYRLEKECDKKVEVVLNDLRYELEQVGGDLKIINTIRRTYQAEKDYYRNQYLSLIK